MAVLPTDNFGFFCLALARSPDLSLTVRLVQRHHSPHLTVAANHVLSRRDKCKHSE